MKSWSKLIVVNNKIRKVLDINQLSSQFTLQTEDRSKLKKRAGINEIKMRNKKPIADPIDHR